MTEQPPHPSSPGSSFLTAAAMGAPSQRTAPFHATGQRGWTAPIDPRPLAPVARDRRTDTNGGPAYTGRAMLLHDAACALVSATRASQNDHSDARSYGPMPAGRMSAARSQAKRRRVCSHPEGVCAPPAGSLGETMRLL